MKFFMHIVLLLYHSTTVYIMVEWYKSNITYIKNFTIVKLTNFYLFSFRPTTNITILPSINNLSDQHMWIFFSFRYALFSFRYSLPTGQNSKSISISKDAKIVYYISSKPTLSILPSNFTTHSTSLFLFLDTKH